MIGAERIPPEWPLEEVKEAQQQVRRILRYVATQNALRRTGKVNETLTINIHPIQQLTFDLSKDRQGQILIADIDTVPLKPAVEFSLAMALSSGDARRVRLCQLRQCKRVFFAEHGRQQFCSAKCKGKTASQRFRERHREALAEKAHGHYRQKTEAKSKGHVQRRKRTTQRKEQ